MSMSQEKLTSAFVCPVIHDKIFEAEELSPKDALMLSKSSYDVDDVEISLSEVTKIFENLRASIHRLLVCFNEALTISISSDIDTRPEKIDFIVKTITLSLQNIIQLYYYKFLHDLKMKLDNIKNYN